MQDRVVCPKCRTGFKVENIVLYDCRATVKIIDHQSTTQRYAPEGHAYVKLGSKGEALDKDGDKVAVQRDGAQCLVEITTKRHQSCCIV